MVPLYDLFSRIPAITCRMKRSGGSLLIAVALQSLFNYRAWQTSAIQDTVDLQPSITPIMGEPSYQRVPGTAGAVSSSLSKPLLRTNSLCLRLRRTTPDERFTHSSSENARLTTSCWCDNAIMFHSYLFLLIYRHTTVFRVVVVVFIPHIIVGCSCGGRWGRRN